MAEIRKYDPAAGSAIAQALRAAMGDPVRPNVPGAPSTRSATPLPPAESVVHLSIKTTIEPSGQDSPDSAEVDD